jgi:hypothetical protein
MARNICIQGNKSFTLSSTFLGSELPHQMPGQGAFRTPSRRQNPGAGGPAGSKKKCVREFLEQIPVALRQTIEHFTTDMWEGYLTAIEEYIAAHHDVVARLVIDRFHVAQHYRTDFDDLRKRELKRLKKELPSETYEQDCKGTLWLLRKNHAALDDDGRLRLRRLLGHSAQLHQAYNFREEMTAIFNQSQSPREGERRFKAWIRKVQASQLDCFNGFHRVALQIYPTSGMWSNVRRLISVHRFPRCLPRRDCRCFGGSAINPFLGPYWRITVVRSSSRALSSRPKAATT